MIKPKKVVIDCDTGTDDAQALLVALKSPFFDVIGITTVAGNVSVDQVTSNTIKVLDVAGAPIDLPIAKGCDRPLIEPVHFCPLIHGVDGLGNQNMDHAETNRKIRPEHAVNFIVETLMAAKEPIVLIPIAPLTNIALALRLEPRIKEKIEKIVLMGGSSENGGNATSWAEANIFNDPEAAHIVFSSGVEIVMYGLDVYSKMSFTPNEIREFLESPNPWAQFSGKLMSFDLATFGLSAAGIGDAGAVITVALPEYTTFQHLHVTIELQGYHTRGMTVVDKRSIVVEPDKPKMLPNIHVVTNIDVDQFKKFFKDTLCQR
jgi:pyrimidine-specific ribonucleoside hydrolase